MNNRLLSVLGTALAQLTRTDRIPAPGRSPGSDPMDPGMGPLVIAAYSLNGDGSLWLDRPTGSYIPLPYHRVMPSPDGSRALVCTGPPEPRFGVLDSPTGDVRWIGDRFHETRTLVAAGWSRNGQEILLTKPDAGFAIVEAASLSVTLVAQDGIRSRNPLGLRYVWTPDGGVALTESHRTDPTRPPAVTGIQFFDRSGAATWTLPATAALTGESGFSPDGTRLALQAAPPFGDTIEVVDAGTGQRRHLLALTGTQVVGWADTDLLIVRKQRQPGLRIITLKGAVIQDVELPSVWAEELQVGSSSGLHPDAWRLTFGEW